MAKPNYAFAKRQRDLAKKQKKEEKKLRKAGPATDGAEGATDEAGADGADGQIQPGDMPVEQVPHASKATAGAGGQSGPA